MAHAQRNVYVAGGNGGGGALPLVVNELLNFVTYKLDFMPPDSIMQLCLSYYAEADIERAKARMFELCSEEGERQDRYIKRTGDAKSRRNLEDIISMATRKSGSMPVVFVSQNLANLPAVTFNSIDVSSLLAKMEGVKQEVDLLKTTVAVQAVVCSDLQCAVAAQAHIGTTLQDTVAGMVAQQCGDEPDAVGGNKGSASGPVCGGAYDGPANDSPANDGPAKVGHAYDGPANDGPANDGPANDGNANDGPENDVSVKDSPANNGSAKDGSAKDGPANDGLARGPVNERPVRVDVKDGHVMGPVNDGPAHGVSGGPVRGVSGGPALEPAKNGPAREHANGTPAREPANDGPVSGSAKDGPAGVLTNDGPAREPSKDGPAREPANDGPAREPVIDGPVRGAWNDGPAREPVIDGPVLEPANDGHVRGASNDSSVRERMNDDPARKPADDSPARVTANDGPARGVAKDGNKMSKLRPRSHVDHERNNGDDGNEWTHVRRRGREPRKRKEIIGSAKNLPIRAAKPMLRVADVFVSRLDPQLIACDLQNYIVGKLHIEVDVELVKVTEHLSSFHVYSQCSQPNVFMSADLWPEGAYVRWSGKTPRQSQNGSATAPKEINSFE